MNLCQISLTPKHIIRGHGKDDNKYFFFEEIILPDCLFNDEVNYLQLRYGFNTPNHGQHGSGIYYHQRQRPRAC